MILDTKDNFQIIGNNAIFAQDEQEQLDYYTSEIEPQFNYPTNPLIIEKAKSIKATSIIRTFFSTKIISSLEFLSENHLNAEDSLPFIQELLHSLNKFRNEHFSDPFASFISALYDAMIFEDSWILIPNEKFKKISKLVKTLNNNPKIDYDKVDKAINALEIMGLETTPY